MPDRSVRTAGPRARRQRFGQRLVLLLFAVSTFGGLFTSTPAPTVRADELDDAYARQEQLEKLIQRQKSSIKDLNASQANLARKIGYTKDSLEQINADLLVVKTQIVGMTVDVARSQNSVDEVTATAKRLEDELARIIQEEARKTAELDARKVLLAERIVEAYDTDRTSMLETFLAGGDFTDVLTNVGYHLDFAEQDRELAEQITSDQEVLKVLHANVELAKTQTEELHQLAKDAKKTLDKQLAELAAARKQLAILEAETQRLLRAQQAAYAKMLRDKKALQANLQQQLANERKLEGLINRLVQEALAKGGIPSQYNGTMQWPMQGRISQEFGCTGFSWEPSYGSCSHFHRGIDIVNAKYTPIRAAAPGKVLIAGLSPYDPAWIVVIAHSEHLVSWYGHVDNVKRPTVRVGEYVAKGQIIAYEGTTGFSTGPHLHWAVQLDSTWVNPRLFLPR
ncbi:MAG TPA: peptidoglycan DD-metalloendopeptidase family protein [Candidatus Limnocylindrales bacterium]|nr:peptidoglycan DD-metalloendopeptidase family protein [Candidatus Limnocylindrales bacterium]